MRTWTRKTPPVPAARRSLRCGCAGGGQWRARQSPSLRHCAAGTSCFRACAAEAFGWDTHGKRGGLGGRAHCAPQQPPRRPAANLRHCACRQMISTRDAYKARSLQAENGSQAQWETDVTVGSARIQISVTPRRCAPSVTRFGASRRATSQVRHPGCCRPH